MRDAAPTILFFNSFFGGSPDVSQLATEDQAAFSTDVTRFATADAVVFHVPNLQDIAGLSKPLGQIWVAWSLESAVNYPAINDPHFLRRVDLVMSYRTDADIWWSYVPDASVWETVRRAPLPAKTEAAPVAMFRSAMHDQSGRSAYAIGLMTQIGVDSYGAMFKTRELPGPDQGRKTKLDAIARYRFCLAFENSIETDYVTEKVYDCLIAGTVPIYLGAPNVADFVPGDSSIINVRDYPDPSVLARHLTDLMHDEPAYQALFAWRRQPLPPRFVELTQPRDHPLCELLRIVRRRRHAQ
jgi:hypothetical protein